MEKIYRVFATLPRWALVMFACCLYALLIYLGGIKPAVEALPGRELHSKVYHVIFYFGLGGLFWFCCRRPSVLKVTALVACAGCLDEIHQHFLAFRHARLSDVAIDTCAGLTAALILHVLRQRATKNAIDCA